MDTRSLRIQFRYFASKTASRNVVNCLNLFKDSSMWMKVLVMKLGKSAFIATIQPQSTSEHCEGSLTNETGSSC